MVEDMLTINVVTKDRPDFIFRMLSYYAAVQYPHWLLVGDGSTGEALEQNRKTIEFFKKTLKIKYHEFPNSSVPEAYCGLLEGITTPYVSCCNDSTFLIPNSLNQCMQFLQDHPDYSAAHGLGVLFELKKPGAFGAIDKMGRYQGLGEVSEKTGAQRLIRYSKNYSVTAYCVFKSQTWKDMWANASLIPDRCFASELLPCCRCVVYGKVKELDCLYMVRHVHQKTSKMADFYDWITSDPWSSSFKIFNEELTNTLAEEGHLPREQAQGVVKQSIWTFLNTSCRTRYYENYHRKNNRFASIEEKLRKRWHRLARGDSFQSMFLRDKKLVLAALLNPNSRYHKDFMPIYKIITEGKSPEFNETTYEPLSMKGAG